MLGWLLLGERPRRGDFATFALFVGALFLVFARPGETQASAPRPVLGNVLAATAGVTWGVTLTGLRRLAQGGGSTLGAVVAGNLLAAGLVSLAGRRMSRNLLFTATRRQLASEPAP